MYTASRSVRYPPLFHDEESTPRPSGSVTRMVSSRIWTCSPFDVTWTTEGFGIIRKIGTRSPAQSYRTPRPFAPGTHSWFGTPLPTRFPGRCQRLRLSVNQVFRDKTHLPGRSGRKCRLQGRRSRGTVRSPDAYPCTPQRLLTLREASGLRYTPGKHSCHASPFAAMLRKKQDTIVQSDR